LGLEPTPQLYVEHLVEVFREAARVLRPDGTLWLNLGDTYCSTAPGTMGDPLHRRGVLAGVKETTAEARRKYRPDTPPGLKPKDLVGIPWRMAFALQDAGWYLRNDIVWSKSSCMPESVRDRCTRSHEYVFLFAHPDSGGRYFYDAEAIREPVGSWAAHDRRYATQAQERVREDEPAFQARRGKPVTGLTRKPMTSRNRRSVWQVNPKPYKGAHFAVWPAKLVDPMVRAGSSQKGACEVCGAPHRRWQDAGTGDEWGASCGCGAGTVPCTVLDPFSGSATTGKVALGLGRDYVGIDLSEANLSLAQARLEGRAAPSAEADDAGALISDLFGDDE